MLKIAKYNTITGEKIDLKELEKYGFNNKYNNDGSYEKVVDYGRTLWVEKNRCIGLEDSMSYFNIGDTLYDLINDGLVEKVEELEKGDKKCMK